MNCRYCADFIGGGKKEMKFHLTYCEYYTVEERIYVLAETIAKKFLGFSLLLGFKISEYIENTFNKWSAQN